ncbi:MAG: hypothetical protein EH224_11915, partial [Calditrichaeota bacterium]
FSQNSAPVVDNVTFSQRTDSSFIVDVYYDLNDLDGDTMSVIMLVSSDSGATWNFSCDSISGAIGCDILSGSGKHIEWDFGAEHPGTNGDRFRVKIYVDDRNNEKGKVTDIDGNIYIVTKIGDQWWMAENLKVTHYSNGDSIPNVTDNSEWGGLTTGAYCNYNNDSTNVPTYGRLYNWYAVDDSRNIAPAGWHVPTDSEWQIMVEYLGGSTVAGGKLKESGTTHWFSPNTGATNESGFSALPGGYLNSDDTFLDMGYYGHWWSSDDYSSSGAWKRLLNYIGSDLGRYKDDKRHGFSVLCVRD